MKGTKQSFTRVNHIKDITPLQEAMINVFIETTHPNLTVRSNRHIKQIFDVSFLVGKQRQIWKIFLCVG